MLLKHIGDYRLWFHGRPHRVWGNEEECDDVRSVVHDDGRCHTTIHGVSDQWQHARMVVKEASSTGQARENGGLYERQVLLRS